MEGAGQLRRRQSTGDGRTKMPNGTWTIKIEIKWTNAKAE